MIGRWRSTEELLRTVTLYREEQDAARGSWPTPRTKMPAFPFPDYENPVLEMLVANANRSIGEGKDVLRMLTHLAVHAWFEGGVAGYDRGQEHGREAAQG